MTRRVSALCGLLALVGFGLPITAAQGAAPLCWGKPATIVGTSGPDDLRGQSGVADVIHGGGGNDSIVGGDFYQEDAIPGRAADLICGGPGDDDIYGGPGNDKINGGDGNDVVNGGRGADLVQGNAGNDQVIDESFADMDSADDVLRGGIGNDYLSTAWGVDKAYGEAGDDVIVDTECSTSYLYGGPGKDLLESWSSSFDGWHTSYCGSGRDYLDGNGQSDRARASAADVVRNVELTERVTQGA